MEQLKCFLSLYTMNNVRGTHTRDITRFLFCSMEQMRGDVLWGSPQLWSDVVFLMSSYGHQAQDIVVPHDMSLFAWSRDLCRNGLDSLTMYALAYLVSISITYRLPMIPYPTSAALLEACISLSNSSNEAYYADDIPALDHIWNTARQNDDLNPVLDLIGGWYQQNPVETNALVVELDTLSLGWRLAFSQPRGHPLSRINPVGLVLLFSNDPLDVVTVSSTVERIDARLDDIRYRLERETDPEFMDTYPMPITVDARRFLSHNTSIARQLLALQDDFDEDERRRMYDVLNQWAQTCDLNNEVICRHVLIYLQHHYIYSTTYTTSINQ